MESFNRCRINICAKGLVAWHVGFCVGAQEDKKPLYVTGGASGVGCWGSRHLNRFHLAIEAAGLFLDPSKPHLNLPDPGSSGVDDGMADLGFQQSHDGDTTRDRGRFAPKQNLCQ